MSNINLEIFKDDVLTIITVCILWHEIDKWKIDRSVNINNSFFCVGYLRTTDQSEYNEF